MPALRNRDRTGTRLELDRHHTDRARIAASRRFAALMFDAFATSSELSPVPRLMPGAPA